MSEKEISKDRKEDICARVRKRVKSKIIIFNYEITIANNLIKVLKINNFHPGI